MIRGPLLLESVERRDNKDRRLTRLKLMLGSRSANFYDLHKVNQVVQHKIITKKIQRQAQERMEKEEECLLWLKKKNNSKEKKNGAQLPLTSKTSPPFIEVILARSPSDLQEGD